jgi:hypothetical protein
LMKTCELSLITIMPTLVLLRASTDMALAVPKQGDLSH